MIAVGHWTAAGFGISREFYTQRELGVSGQGEEAR